ncbi:MAG: DUF4209 domain-containing protein [Rivularia sp. (in: cyanobacteria)]
MSPLNLTLTKDDFINSGWEEIVNNSEKKECIGYSMSFWEKAEEANVAGNVKEKAVFEILAAVSGAGIKEESNEEFFAEIFQNLTDEHLNFLAEIAPEISDPELQARVADILWVRKCVHEMAKLAVDAYLQSATELEDPQQWKSGYERIERALRLSRRIKYHTDVVFAHIEKVLDFYKGEDRSFFSAKLMELLLEYRFGEPIKYATLAEKAAKLAESANNWHRARNYWEIKAQWHSIEENEEQGCNALMAAAETYVKEAEDALKRTPPSYSVASHFMQKAYEAFKRIPAKKEDKIKIVAKARAEEVHKMLLDYQEESTKEFISLSHEIDISNQVEQAKAQVRGKEFNDAIFALALLGTSPKISYLRQEIQENSESFYAIPKVMVNEVGKVTARQPSNFDEAETAMRFEMYRSARVLQSLHAQQYIEPARYQINLEHNVRIKDFISIISYSPFVPPNREYLFAKGLYAGLTGDSITCTHILVPQIENSIRYLLSQRGVLTSGIDNYGIQKEHQLSTTLYSQEIESIFDEDTLFDLKGLLIEKSGSNLRNRIDHGLINDNGFLSPLMSYLWWLTLRLCCLPILQYQQKVEQSDPWVKFAGMFKDDPLFDEFVEDMATYRQELDAQIADDENTLEENESA